MLSDLAVVEL
jgi:hypothetical protein